jgi:hypothetical protein
MHATPLTAADLTARILPVITIAIKDVFRTIDLLNDKKKK